MRILFVTPVVPSRAYGRRPYNFLRYLRGKHDLFLATFLTDQEYDLPYIEELESWGIQVHTVSRPRMQSVGKCLLAPVTGWPLRGLYVRSGSLSRLIGRIAADCRPDIFHFDRMRMGQYAKNLDRRRCIVDFTDSIPLYLERKQAFTRSSAQRAVDWWERRTIPTFEERMLKWNSTGILCSEVDTQYFLNMHPGANVRTIFNMVDPEEWKPKEEISGEPRGVYTGTLSYEPNIDALGYLVREIMPLVWKELPEFRLLVYGTRPGRQVLSMLDDHRVQLFANVPRLSDELSQGDIYLCPIRVGSGMRNKILEAMATEMAVVSTTIGCEGMGLEDGKQIAIADSAEEFANRMVHLAREQAERQLLGKTGREFVLQNHHPQLIGAQLEAAYGEILNQGKG
jgi:glycosyltransferase involved in cell wall biosynthesis